MLLKALNNIVLPNKKEVKAGETFKYKGSLEPLKGIVEIIPEEEIVEIIPEEKKTEIEEEPELKEDEQKEEDVK